MNWQVYLLPYLFSNAIALLILLAAWKSPRWARWSLVFLFLAASIFNAYTASTTPEVYLTYGEMSIPLYTRFIYGWFADHAQLMVTLIAIGQLTVALLLSLHGRWRSLGMFGGIIFLMAIAPLGLGSAFPCSLLLAAALLILYRHEAKQAA
ncbi:MAG TPA: hypothetical protein PKC76_18050 [Saprospiraceae bacterium]|nr:hypothetical protein [Saprospiraceae bacterium]HMP26037.1 hypothetical protein [Saprospiraceae bacterium]